MIASSLVAIVLPIILMLRLDAPRPRGYMPILVYHQVRDVPPTYPLTPLQEVYR